MPVTIEASTTSILMNDPALRVIDKSFCADRKVSEPNIRALKNYQSSSIALPSIWEERVFAILGISLAFLARSSTLTEKLLPTIPTAKSYTSLLLVRKYVIGFTASNPIT